MQYPFHNVVRTDPAELDPILEFWGRLPLDPYLKEGFRDRALTRFEIGESELRPIPHGEVMQSSKNNPRWGDLPRKFEPLDPQLLEHPVFQSQCRKFLDSLPIETLGHILWVHQIRVRQDGPDSRPVPEGIHRDERKFVGVMVVNYQQLRSGPTHLYTDPQQPSFFQTQLEAGDMLVFHDELLYHYTEDFINPDIRNGHRDIFIFALTEDDEQGTPQGYKQGNAYT